MKQYWSEGEFVEFWTLTDVKRQFSGYDNHRNEKLR
jgi:hypothetical protein